MSSVLGQHAPNLADLTQLYPTLEEVQGIKNFLDILTTIDSDERNLEVLDDQMSEAGKVEESSNLFSKESHHRNITVVYIVQNVFHKGKVHRTFSLNSHYMVLFKNPRDEGQMRSIAL